VPLRAAKTTFQEDSGKNLAQDTRVELLGQLSKPVPSSGNAAEVGSSRSADLLAPEYCRSLWANLVASGKNLFRDIVLLGQKNRCLIGALCVDHIALPISARFIHRVLKTYYEYLSLTTGCRCLHFRALHRAVLDFIRVPVGRGSTGSYVPTGGELQATPTGFYPLVCLQCPLA